jgi:serine protease AprX
VAGLQWVLENKNNYNIRVVNMSMNSSVAESYKTSPLDAAVEILWFNGIVVVVSAGNAGSGVINPPANDPFVITVGAVDDKGTKSISDDSVPSFSAYGKTQDNFSKPDLVAPGVNIVAKVVNENMGLAGAHPNNRITTDAQYFRMSGTSMAAPMVSGAVALLLQKEPGLTPDQVKYRLTSTANKSWAGYNANKAGAGYLDINAAVKSSSKNSANTGKTASTLLTTGPEPINSSVSWNSVSWNSVSWNSVSWNSVSWNSVASNSVSWNSVSWNSDFWGN